ncbi:MAG TPA: nucleotidyltransferase family protein [Tepidisphaeraceae bacterium]|nr:nucleotidyltransferase family protein [Tepidisphaeraceae bacterium]
MRPAKAFLLAAGVGSRMGALTAQTPKCLLPIAGQPLLGIWLDACAHHGIEEVLVNLHAHPRAVLNYLATRSRPRCRTVYEPDLLGSCGTVASNRAWVEHEQAFWILYGDVLTNCDLSRMAAAFDPLAMATLGVMSVPDPGRCGIATVNAAGWITRFDEKPAQPSGNLAFSGIMLASRSMLDALPTHTPADIGFDLLPRLVPRLRAFPIQEFLMDIGNPERYADAQLRWPGFLP